MKGQGIGFRLRWVPGIMLAIVVGLLFRVTPVWSLVFEQGSPRLLGIDSHYHLRHVGQTAADFPRLSRDDDVSRFPLELRSDSVGLMQWILGGGAAVLGAGHDAALMACAITGPLQWILISFAFVFLVARTYGAGMACFLLWLLVLLPGSLLERTLLGFCDHHGIEVFLNLSILAGLIAKPSGWIGRVLIGAPAGIYLLTTLGAPLFIGLALLSLFGLVLISFRSGSGWGGALIHCAAWCVSSGVWSLVLLRVFPDFAPDPGRAWSVGLILFLVGLLLTAQLLLRPYLADFAPRFPFVLIASALVFLPFLGMLIWFPHLLSDLAYAIFPKSALIAEQNPLAFGTLVRQFGILLPFSLWGLWLGVCQSRGTGWPMGIMAINSALICGVSILSGDYGYNLSPFLILLSAPAFHLVWRRIQNLNWPVSGQSAIPILGLVGVLLLSLPGSILSGTIKPPSFFQQLSHLSPAWKGALAWLATQSPSGAVWCHWPYGNFLPVYADWPSIASRYPHPEALAPLLQTDEEPALNEAVNGRPLRDNLKYLILDARFLYRDLFTELLPLGLPWDSFHGKVLQAVAPGQVPLLVPGGERFNRTLAGRFQSESGNGLHQFRLVYQSPQMIRVLWLVDDARRTARTEFADPESVGIERSRADRIAEEFSVPELKIYEFVGAFPFQLIAPGGVDARLTRRLRVEGSAQTLTYGQDARLLENGSFQWMLPNEPETRAPALPGSVIPVGDYLLTVWFDDGTEKIISLPPRFLKRGAVKLDELTNPSTDESAPD